MVNYRRLINEINDEGGKILENCEDMLRSEAIVYFLIMFMALLMGVTMWISINSTIGGYILVATFYGYLLLIIIFKVILDRKSRELKMRGWIPSEVCVLFERKSIALGMILVSEMVAIEVFLLLTFQIHAPIHYILLMTIIAALSGGVFLFQIRFMCRKGIRIYHAVEGENAKDVADKIAREFGAEPVEIMRNTNYKVTIPGRDLTVNLILNGGGRKIYYHFSGQGE